VASEAANIFLQAARRNLADNRRRGNVVMLEGAAEIIVSGDVHGHKKNLEKILAHAAVERNPSCRLVLQEIIHGPPDSSTGLDLSVDPLLQVAKLKVSHPKNIVFLLGNHDVAQIAGNEITKDGRRMCQGFVDGVNNVFGGDGPEVMAAILEFLLSMPIAARCPNGVFLSHSLPSPKRWSQACSEILQRRTTPEDLTRGGAAYEWTWGRNHTPEYMDELAGVLGAELFVLGHYHLDVGHKVLSDRAITLASYHGHASVMEFYADSAMTIEDAHACIRPVVALGAH